MTWVCRRKLAKKSDECDNLLKEYDRRNTLISGLTADRDKAAANAAAAQAKLRKLASEAAAGPHIPAVDASKVGQGTCLCSHVQPQHCALLTCEAWAN